MWEFQSKSRTSVCVPNLFDIDGIASSSFMINAALGGL